MGCPEDPILWGLQTPLEETCGGYPPGESPHVPRRGLSAPNTVRRGSIGADRSVEGPVIGRATTKRLAVVIRSELDQTWSARVASI